MNKTNKWLIDIGSLLTDAVAIFYIKKSKENNEENNNDDNDGGGSDSIMDDVEHTINDSGIDFSFD